MNKKSAQLRVNYLLRRAENHEFDEREEQILSRCRSTAVRLQARLKFLDLRVLKEYRQDLRERLSGTL